MALKLLLRGCDRNQPSEEGKGRETHVQSPRGRKGLGNGGENTGDLARAFWLRERVAGGRRWYGGEETTGRNLDFIPAIVYSPGIRIC